MSFRMISPPCPRLFDSNSFSIPECCMHTVNNPSSMKSVSLSKSYLNSLNFRSSSFIQSASCSRSSLGITLRSLTVITRKRSSSIYITNSLNSDSSSTNAQASSPLELPCLPFALSEKRNPLHQVFIPSSAKTLHLYEARFLALLDESMKNTEGLFVHIVIEPLKTTEGNSSLTSLIASYGCLVKIENVKRLSVGALVTVRGIGRIKLLKFTQLEPYLKGQVIPLQDQSMEESEEKRNECENEVNNLLNILEDIQQLQMKLKYSRPEDSLETPLNRALQWAKKTQMEGMASTYLPSLQERISFAALQPLTGASGYELQRLLQQRLLAMEEIETRQRIANVLEYSLESRASIAAKLALQEVI